MYHSFPKGKEEEPGIAQLLFQQQKKRAQVLELETAPTPGSFTVKDLTSPTSKPQTIHRHQHDSNLSNTIKHFKRCTANCLRDVEKRRDTLEVGEEKRAFKPRLFPLT